MKNILLATNGKKNSRHAEAFAISQCRRHGATLSVAYVLDCDLQHYGQIDQLATEVDKTDFINYVHQQAELEARSLSISWQEKAKQNNIDVQVYLGGGKLANFISQTAADLKADVVIIGGRAPRLFTNSRLSRKLSQNTSCPVRHIP